MEKKFFLLGFVFLCFPFFGAQAKNNWENYFTRDESKAIKKMVGKHVINQFENKDENWRKIISSSSIKDGAVTTDKIDENAVTTDKIDENAVTVAKIRKKIYTGTLPGDNDAATGSTSYSHGDGETFYMPVEVPELDVDDSTIDVKLMMKYTTTTNNADASSRQAATAFGTYWGEEELDILQDETVYVQYLVKNESDVTTWYADNDYKLVITY